MSFNFHERLEDATDAGERPSNRSFGITVGGLLAGLGGARALANWDVDLAVALLLGTGGMLITLAILSPERLETANRLWMRLGALLGRIMNPVILILVYVTAFVPIGLMMRLWRHDPLRTRPASGEESFWIRREAPDRMVRNMPHQF